jgi:hypothetical protein
MAGRIDRNRRLCQHCQCPIGSHAPLRPFPPTLPFDTREASARAAQLAPWRLRRAAAIPGTAGTLILYALDILGPVMPNDHAAGEFLMKQTRVGVRSLATMLLSYCADTSDVPSASACRAPADVHASRRLWAAQSGATDSTVENTEVRNRRPAQTCSIVRQVEGGTPVCLTRVYSSPERVRAVRCRELLAGAGAWSGQPSCARVSAAATRRAMVSSLAIRPMTRPVPWT